MRTISFVPGVLHCSTAVEATTKFITHWTHYLIGRKRTISFRNQHLLSVTPAPISARNHDPAGIYGINSNLIGVTYGSNRAFNNPRVLLSNLRWLTTVSILKNLFDGSMLPNKCPIIIGWLKNFFTPQEVSMATTWPVAYLLWKCEDDPSQCNFLPMLKICLCEQHSTMAR